jgi:hypothetical protein
MASFTPTIEAFKKGITKMTASAAVKNIESWEGKLESVEVSGSKTILRDLSALKNALQMDEPDSARICELMSRLGTQTSSIAEKAERGGDKLTQLGEALTQAGEEGESSGSSSSKSRPKSARATR